MKKSKMFYKISAFVVCLALTGCAPMAKTIDSNTEFHTMGLDYNNLKDLMQGMVDSLLQDPYVQKIKTGTPKVVAISDIINDTTQKIDVESLSRELTRAMRKSGKFKLTLAVARSGGSKDQMISDARELRNDKEFDQYTTAEEGTLSAPSLSLSGKIGQRIYRNGNVKKVDYYILLTLTDIKSGEVIWDEQKEISKLGNGNLW
ncbi:penicillin-binding protein activator LpoB [Helicobacter sp. faydin-H20]|uniref:penicillin-binding protein activator LpoB n=1 Tax=Helicobacter anatolicus TaxID=2905874 RepID=UPI001E4FB50F|nr:penicillin-binding protein activator LpoB [Helicobacter anatolicus]MCE3036385.1 penicillin-binding protein activator LpoB [Helicobacter anatolicus]